MKRIACALLFVCVFRPSSSAQMQRQAGRDAASSRQFPPFYGEERLPARPGPPNSSSGAADPASGTVSVSELRVPFPARKELMRYQQSLQSGNLRESVKHLTKAIQIYSQIPAAHQNLGACYIRLNEYENAVSEFQTASEMDKHMIQPVLGLAGAYLVLGRYGDSELASRRALGIDSVNSMARYLLGRALAFEGRDIPETVELLRASSAQYPDAHLALAGIMLKRNAQDEALKELREYVRRPEVPQKYKETIGCAIEKLTGKSENINCALVLASPTAQN
jgi:tetratricopeptide (TPR) repeat protein